MSWAQDRVERYRLGQPASWLERRMLEHANPVHFVVAIASSAILFTGLWLHNWLWICGGLFLALLGHVYCWLWAAGSSKAMSRQ